MQQQKRSFIYVTIVSLIFVFCLMIYLAYQTQHSTTTSSTTNPTLPLPTHQQNKPAAAIATKNVDKRFIQRLSKSFDHCIWPKCNLFGKQYLSLFTRTTIAGIAATIVRGIAPNFKIPLFENYPGTVFFIIFYFASFNLETEVIRFRCAKTPEHYELKCVKCAEEFVEENKVHIAAIEGEIKAINNSIKDCNARNKGQTPLSNSNEKRDDSVDMAEEKRKQEEALNALQHCREVIVAKIKRMESFIEIYRRPFLVWVKEYLEAIFPVAAWQEWIVFLRSKKAMM